jgi:hypothetical protein
MADNYRDWQIPSRHTLPALVLSLTHGRLNMSVSTTTSPRTSKTCNKEAFGNLESPLKRTKALLSRKALARSRKSDWRRYSARIPSIWLTWAHRDALFAHSLHGWLQNRVVALIFFKFLTNYDLGVAAPREVERNGLRGLTVSYLPSPCVYPASFCSTLLANAAIFIFCRQETWRLCRSTPFARCRVDSSVTCRQITIQLLFGSIMRVVAIRSTETYAYDQILPIPHPPWLGYAVLKKLTHPLF